MLKERKLGTLYMERDTYSMQCHKVLFFFQASSFTLKAISYQIKENGPYKYYWQQISLPRNSWNNNK